jgi:PPK2 family polyphosphate:nucleotide phosphotransferase
MCRALGGSTKTSPPPGACPANNEDKRSHFVSRKTKDDPILARYRVPTNKKKISLKDVDTRDKTSFPDRDEAEEQTAADVGAIAELQNRLYAEGKHALLIVFQATDTGGKDSTIRKVLGPINPQGVRVTSFKAPTSTELAHDYLWRIHQAVPAKGMIGVFNRSHYEDVLIVRVHGLAPKEAIEQRYDQINDFEKHLTENSVTILKFLLHISKEEQKERLQARLDDPSKHWKFNPSDLEERKHWDDYQDAAEIALSRCSTRHAPWHVIPADRKWHRNAVIARIIRRTLEDIDPQYPEIDYDPSGIVID